MLASEEEVGATSSVSKGPTLIIAHVGSESGFIPNALLIFKLQTKTGDYHGEMNFDNFS
jgi:hypothetical protein